MLKILFSLVTVTKEKATATHVRTEITAVSSDDTAMAKEATTDHADLQLQITKGLATPRALTIVLLFRVCHVREYIPNCFLKDDD